MEHAQIVIRTVKNQALSRKHLIERLEGESGEWIDKEILVLGANLNKAQFFEIAVKAIRFGVQSDSGEGGELGDEIGQALRI
jgi:hypothetical protein